ncbi:GNAT family N-acetyltransferase [uncultured Maricaulis sp.]|uniref:GNAT family N-acetyltransferase n=1 Tax=uncultured Maricaulis sp. TaxID=174710 RepID=UPI0030DAF0AA|tara:strand:+ start:5075 stop:5641 length:567 start_codon:yes stop_codon:yes gene_type:complete
MSDAPHIRALTAEDITARLDAFCDLLLDIVEGGASVGFMAPLSRDRARQFWQGIIASVERGERILLAATDGPGGRVTGSVQLVLAQPDNQPHRGDVSKMLVHSSARKQGLGAALLAAIETAALEAGKTLLVLDTVPGTPADRLYQRAGWTALGVIPGYALMPDGAPSDTRLFWRQIGPAVYSVTSTRP